MISKVISVTAIAGTLAGSAAIAQNMPNDSATAAPPPAQAGATQLGPSPINEATPGATTPSGATLPDATPVPAQAAPALVPSNGETQTVGVPVPDGEPVAQLPNASQALQGATVQSADGATIGTVQGVTTDPGGAAQKVTVAVNGDANIPAHRIGIAASDLHYQSTGNLVVAELTQQELQTLAAARTPGDVRP